MPSLSSGSACVGRRKLVRAIRTYATCTGVGAILLGLSVASATAASGGVGLTPPPAASPVPKPSKPQPAKQAARAQIADIRCVGNPGAGCIEPHRVDRGGTIALTGRSLTGLTQAIFYGQKGKQDDVIGPVQGVSATRLVATVPAPAQSGPIAVIDAAGRRSVRWDGLVVESPQEWLSALRPAGPITPVQAGVSEPRTIFFGGMQKSVFNYRVTGTRPVDVVVTLVRLSDNAVVRTWERRGTAPGVAQHITWNGAVNGRAQPAGRYAFRVSTPGVVGSSAQSAPPGGDDAVTLLGYVFPIKGKHQFAMGAGRFGAARRGHTHEGQDVMAACGTPLVAARGGTVIYSGYHALAGYYLVVDGQGTGVDYGYMHLREPALVGTGARVYTGQPIGEVGDTGDAQGCHLHFEEWTAPGWYKGGHPYDPLPDLKRWDVGG